MADDKIRIKDIAQRAGVSVGTVDRVLHNRPNVSAVAREQVEQALKEMNYEPNVYASALAYNRTYNFWLILPQHESEAYWDEVEEGAKACQKARRDFHVSVHISYYQRTQAGAFTTVADACIAEKPDGVVVVPATLELTRQFTDRLHELDIPFVMLDSYMPDLRPLSFFGQDSFQSGYFAARMLMLIASRESEIMLFKQMREGWAPSKQQQNRETGFRHYMHDHFPDINIVELLLPLDSDRRHYDTLLEHFFKDHPQVHHGITFNSKAHIVGQYLLRSNRRNVQVMGYDVVAKNAECVRQGSISFLIAQHGYMQGFNSVSTLFNAVVLKKKVEPVNYMPIELLSKENIDFYRRKP